MWEHRLRCSGRRRLRLERDLVCILRIPFSYLPAQHLTTPPSDNQDKVETYLAFGASRFEASLPIAREALRLALTPTINQMRSVFLTLPDSALIRPRA